MPYFVYILKCNDGTLYTGVTNNIEKRILAHNTSKAGAKYTASRRPVTLQYSETLETKSLALKREAQIKTLTREQKQTLISNSKYETTKTIRLPKIRHPDDASPRT